MNEYTLYLDESETCNVNKETGKREDKTFVIAGIIAEDRYHNNVLVPRINNLKNNIWNRCDKDSEYENYVFHELEMTYAITKRCKQIKNEYNKVFKNKHIYNMTYDIMTEIIKTSEISIISSCINENMLKRLYRNQKINDRLSIGMNIIIENYYHFLHTHNGVGKIIYESMPDNQNAKIRRRYNQIRYNGTMFYPAKTINERIKDLSFVNKYNNCIGLQIADFMPNAIGRAYLQKEYNNNRERSIPYDIIFDKVYDGMVGKFNRFGIKNIP